MVPIVFFFTENVHVSNDVDEHSDAVDREHVRLSNKQPPHSVYAGAVGGSAAQSTGSVSDAVHDPHPVERHRDIHPRQTVPNAHAL